MLKLISFFILNAFLITGNIMSQDLNSDNTQRDSSEFYMKMFNDGVDFYANGNEPFWSLSMANDQFLKFSELEGLEINLGSVKGEKAMDANVIRYSDQTEKGFFSVTISEQECFDDMSGEKFNYRVTVELNNPGDPDHRKFEGCGNYVPDYRLNRTWKLKQIGEDVVVGSDYTKGVPEITFDIGKGRFSGSGGCNRVTGAVYSENNILRFSKVASTMMSCPDPDLEVQFLSALEKVVNYNLAGNELTLSNPDGNLLILTDPTLESTQSPGIEYADNYRLNDIWVLETINGSLAEEKNYMKGLPRIEISIEDMTVKGNGGCNQISCTFIADTENIKFGPVAATRMACPGNYESDFLSALDGANKYKIENNRLYLMQNDITLMVLKKTD